MKRPSADQEVEDLYYWAQQNRETLTAHDRDWTRWPRTFPCVRERSGNRNPDGTRFGSIYEYQRIEPYAGRFECIAEFNEEYEALAG